MQVVPTDIASKSHVTPLPRYSIDPSDLLETKNASANECDPPLAFAIKEKIAFDFSQAFHLVCRSGSSSMASVEIAD